MSFGHDRPVRVRALALEVRLEVLGERAQDAADQLLLLDGQEAAVAVGDDREPVVDALEARVGAASGRDVVERARDRAGTELARRALPARLDEQEPREHGRDVDHARGVVVDDEPRRAEPAARAGERLERERTCRAAPRSAPRSSRREAPRGSYGPVEALRSIVEHLAQRRAALDLDDARPARRRRRPCTRPFPATSAVPNDRYQSAPFASTCATLASVSTLLTDVGFDSWPARVSGFGFVRLPAELRRGREQAVHVRREPARQRVVAFDDLEQRLLLAEEVLLGAGDDPDREITDEPGLLHLGDRRA